MADYMAGKKPQGRIQEASQSVGSIATINKEPLIGLMKSTIGDAVSLPCALSLLPSPLSALSPAPARRRRA